MSASPPRGYDPLTFEVIKGSLHALVEEVGLALARSAYSTNIKTRQDFSCAIFDSQARCVAQAFAQASHLGSLVLSVPMALKEYGVENLSPTDGILINDAHRGMVHLNDVSLITPLWYHGKIFGYSVNVAHHVDVGGKAPGSIAVSSEIYQEGIILPGVKFVKNGEIDPDMLKLITANVRGKRESAGDFRAQVAANKLADRRMKELLDRFGVDVLDKAINQLYDYTESRVRAALREIPEGEYENVGYMDDDGITDKPIRLAAKVRVSGGGVTIDLSGSDEQNNSFANSTYAMSYSATAYTVKCLVPDDIPVNDGFYRAVKVIAPPGKVVNATFPHTVAAGWEVSLKTTETVFGAWAKAVPERIPAEGKKTLFHVAFGGRDPRDGEDYAFLETVAGGYGARPTKDGEEAVQAHHQNTENSPVEELEIGYPVMIAAVELVADSEGPGRFRGGMGVRRVYKFLDHEPVVTLLADTAKIPPHGLRGGLDARVAKFVYYPDAGRPPEALPSKTTFRSRANGILVVETPGGGGYGSALMRDPEAVLEDVRNGKVSLERAEAIYGVAIDVTRWEVEVAKTRELRMPIGEEAA